MVHIWSNKPAERLNKDFRRCTGAVSIFSTREAIIRLVRAVLAEQTDEWVEGQRYLGLDVLARYRLHIVPDTANKEMPTNSFQHSLPDSA